MKIEESPVYYDAVITGATPSGIATAVRAAREGLKVLLVSQNPHIGGILSNGLSSWDTHFEGVRAVVQQDWLELVKGHYARTYGTDSEQYRQCVDGPFGGGPHMGHVMFEPHVAEEAFETLVRAERGITIVRGFRPVTVERAQRKVVAVIYVGLEGQTFRAAGASFVDASYEGDMAALAGVEYRVGRESRAEYNEQHAGRIFMKRSGAEEDFPVDDYGQLQYPRAARHKRLNLRPWFGVTQEIFSESTGEGDSAVQASNFRLTLAREAHNRRSPFKPDGYDRNQFLPVAITPDDSAEIEPIALKSGLVVNDLVNFPGWLPVPNGKADWNMGAIPGGLDEFPDGDPNTRQKILDRHRNVALGLLYFLQTDEAVPAHIRAEACEFGLPMDEFVENDGFPYEWYLREARRIVGRYVFTENDARLAVGLRRAPVHSDSIAFTEWLLDSHDCTADRVQGSLGDGFTTLTEVTRPGQVPYASLLPKDLDNLLVTGTLSASHMGWGTVRVEPTLTHIGESAGYALSLAFASGRAPANIDVDALQWQLAEAGVVITFFNEFDGSSRDDWAPAVQYLGTKGFFESYDARPNLVLDEDTAAHWARGLGAILDGTLNPNELARKLPIQLSDGGISSTQFVELLKRELVYRELPTSDLQGIAEEYGATPISRADGCKILVRVLTRTS